MTYKKDYVETLEKHTAEMRAENERLREENERLRNENYRLRDLTKDYTPSVIFNSAYANILEAWSWFRDER